MATDGTSKGRRVRWLSASGGRFAVQGLAWFRENGGTFSRLPLRAKGRVPEIVWDLAQCPASARIAFRSDTTRLAVRVTDAALTTMDHMASTGQNGLALYCGEPGRMRYWATARPGLDSPTFESVLFENVPRRVREFRLYLPLYQEMKSLDIALSAGARVLAPSPFRLAKPVVFYGTSITQGGCASTAGGDFISAVGRRLNVEVVNLGFSGSGRGEPEVARFVAEIDAALFVLDYASNAEPATFPGTLAGFVRILRRRHRRTPILLLTSPCYSKYDFDSAARGIQESRRDTMIARYIEERRRGDPNIHLADGFGLIPFGTDGAFVDGVHPTSHGFEMMAERLAPFVEQILFRDA